MKKKITDLQSIKDNVSLPFLYLDIESDGFFVQHPYLETSVVSVRKDIAKGYDIDNVNLVDIISDTNGYKLWIKEMTVLINEANDLNRLYFLVRKSYRLTFLKYAKEYMSKEDFSSYFADAWVSSENPNQDVNCSIKLLTKWFKECNKKILMSKEEYEVYTSLPDEFRVYRGVAVGREPKGLSWTENLEKAKWFADRFNNSDNNGYVQSAFVKKEDVLAYFNTRNEDEMVVDVSKLNIEVLR